MAVVAGYHLIWTAYGWWLPNDPRGSMSQQVNCVALQDLGELHFGRKRIQPARRVVKSFYTEARNRLEFDLLKFSQREVTAIGAAFADTIKAHNYTCHACAVMPDHVHLLIRKHRHKSEEMIERLQAASCESVVACGQRDPLHPVWTHGGWKGSLEKIEEIRRTIRYIELNPVKIGLPQQQWDFVSSYNGWLPMQVTRVKPPRNNRER